MNAPAVRPYRASDEARVLDVVRADARPGRPPCTAEMLALALAGMSPDDADRWNALLPPVVEVATDHDDQVTGVVSYAVRPSDTTGAVLWLHAMEDPAVVSTLLDRAFRKLAPHVHRYEAFTLTTPLNHDFDGIPLRRRAETHAALLAAGFVPTYMGQYLHRDLAGAEAPSDPPAVVMPSRDPAYRRLSVQGSAGTVTAEAVVREPVDGVGELYWISVEPANRGNGLGRRLLRQALVELVELGASQVVLLVDDDEPDSERDRTAAVHLYESAGFRELDRIHTYTCEGVPAHARLGSTGEVDPS